MFLNAINDDEKKAFIVLAQELIRADGVIAQAEDYYISLFLDEMEMDILPRFVDHDAAVQVIQASDMIVRRKLYMELYALAKCDLDYADSEKKFMDELAEQFGITAEKQEELEKCVDDFTQLYIRIDQALED